jgi:hypothetical protein
MDESQKKLKIVGTMALLTIEGFGQCEISACNGG